MKIAFIYNGAENLGIEYISAFLKSKGHVTSLFYDPAVFSSDVFINSKILARILNIDKEIVRSVIASEPDIVAFSVYTGNYKWCLSIARSIKERTDIPIVFGGVHATAVPEKVLENEFVDFCIIGEGEYAIIDLINHLSNSRSKDSLIGVSNICFKSADMVTINKPRPYIQDLDSLPFPDKNLFFDKEPLFLNNPYLIMTSRGCPYRCSYCSNDMIQSLYCHEDQHIRRRSPDNVITELVEIKQHYRIKSICFVDDVFTISKPWLEDFIEKYRLCIDLPFYCNIHPLAFSRDIARLLKEGGCRLIFLGVQSGSERIRREIFSRRETNESIIRAVNYLREMKIKISVDHIFGAPSEGEVDLCKSLDLYRNIKPDILLTFWLTYYPRTSIIAIARKSGILSDNEIKNIDEGNIGFTHDIGCVDKNKIPLYKKYELLFELITIVPYDRIYNIFARLVIFLPFKKFISLCIYTINGLKYFRPWILNKFRYVFSCYNSP
jgi:radical SAM superfamily enzyme YgiQ (UPF0313 family)